MQTCGIFPEAPPGAAAQASLEYYELNLRRGWTHGNYASFDDHRALATQELHRLVECDFLEDLGSDWSAWPRA